jgi:hypothetical protein
MKQTQRPAAPPTRSGSQACRGTQQGTAGKSHLCAEEVSVLGAPPRRKPSQSVYGRRRAPGGRSLDVGAPFLPPNSPWLQRGVVRWHVRRRQQHDLLRELAGRALRGLRRLLFAVVSVAASLSRRLRRVSAALTAATRSPTMWPTNGAPVVPGQPRKESVGTSKCLMVRRLDPSVWPLRSTTRQTPASATV